MKVYILLNKYGFLKFSLVGKEVVWIQDVLFELNFTQNCIATIFFDNQSAIQVEDSLIFHTKIKHVEIHIQYI